jgi:hypothetical protein
MRTRNKNTDNINKNREPFFRILAEQGKAKKHTFPSAEIWDLGKKAEAKCASLGLPKSRRQGAEITITSGGSVPLKYAYPRRVSIATFRRGKTDWFLTSIVVTSSWCRSAGNEFAKLTPTQSDYLVKRVTSQFGGITPEPLELLANPSHCSS